MLVRQLVTDVLVQGGGWHSACYTPVLSPSVAVSLAPSLFGSDNSETLPLGLFYFNEFPCISLTLCWLKRHIRLLIHISETRWFFLASHLPYPVTIISHKKNSTGVSLPPWLPAETKASPSLVRSPVAWRHQTSCGEVEKLRRIYQEFWISCIQSLVHRREALEKSVVLFCFVPTIQMGSGFW